MDNLKNHLKFLWSIKPHDDSLSLSEIKKDEGILIDVETAKLISKFDNSIIILKRYIQTKKANQDIIKDLISIESLEILIQTNKLIEVINHQNNLMNFIFSWKINFEKEIIKIQSSYEKSKFKTSIIELVELCNFLEYSKNSLIKSMKKFHI
jgi:hypothetical protein